ncbi:hypothetical protein AWC17_13295 [Mycobacterium nebraskense]|uniref:EccD-like transmembrane domain-containing protein n=1 Tax=Mycobacterium nebraskense TaxID=244292 RepID=A0A1X1Z1F7_9MYCO|nr:type VII secretion integral membrane protein EccD [Mycobacterium nebraskense]ORW17169.1 hypothetical protein AWC17_13295 [Mycobacterium nebraskense]
MSTAADVPAAVGLPAVTRVAIFVGSTDIEAAAGAPGGVELDFSLPSGQQLVAVVEAVRGEIDRELHRRRLPTLNPRTTYVLCRADGRALDLDRTLEAAGVLDGEALWLLPVEATERFSRVIERVSTGVARSAAEQFAVVDPIIARRMATGLLAVLAAWMELILANLWAQAGSLMPAGASAVAAAALAGGAWVAAGSPVAARRRTADPLAWTALLCTAFAAGMAVPGRPGGWHVAAAALVVVIGAALLDLITGRFPGAAALCVTLGVVAMGAAIASVGGHIGAQRISVAVLTVSVFVVTYAANAGGLISGAPMPAFPSIRSRGTFERAPGAPRNTVSPVPGEQFVTGEQLARWARRGTLTATGMIVAAGLLVVGACRWVVQPGTAGDWRFVVFAVGICVIVALRSQSLIDRVQSIALTCAAVLGVAVIIGRYAAATVPAHIATTAVCALLVAVLAVGVVLGALWLPTASLKAPLRRAVMGVELLLTVVLTVPWMLWLMNAFAALRHMRH